LGTLRHVLGQGDLGDRALAHEAPYAAHQAVSRNPNPNRTGAGTQAQVEARAQAQAHGRTRTQKHRRAYIAGHRDKGGAYRPLLLAAALSLAARSCWMVASRACCSS
jgi:hypothetical protein